MCGPKLSDMTAGGKMHYYNHRFAGSGSAGGHALHARSRRATCHVIGSRLYHETRIQSALDDVASNIRQTCVGRRGEQNLQDPTSSSARSTSPDRLGVTPQWSTPSPPPGLTPAAARAVRSTTSSQPITSVPPATSVTVSQSHRTPPPRQ
jgi:hypothetical protein